MAFCAIIISTYVINSNMEIYTTDVEIKSAFKSPFIQGHWAGKTTYMLNDCGAYKEASAQFVGRITY